MRVLYDKNGFEILNNLSYLYKRDLYRNGKDYFKFKKCLNCNEYYFANPNKGSLYCCKECSSQSHIVKLKLTISSTGRKKSPEERIAISKRMSKGDVVKLNIPLYDTFAERLSIAEEVIRDSQDSKILNVKCSQCKKWFRPGRAACDNRIQFILGHTDRENRLYCSEECKNICSIFHKKLYPRGKNPRKHRNNFNYTESNLRTWSKVVLEGHNYICEVCGEKAVLSHHIIPKKVDPCKALDIDNGLALCEFCHIKLHSNKDECSYINLSRLQIN